MWNIIQLLKCTFSKNNHMLKSSDYNAKKARYYSFELNNRQTIRRLGTMLGAGITT